MIHSTFRNIDALVQDKSLVSLNEDNQHERDNPSQDQCISSPYEPYSHQEHQQRPLQSPPKDINRQLPPPLNPVETRITR